MATKKSKDEGDKPAESLDILVTPVVDAAASIELPSELASIDITPTPAAPAQDDTDLELVRRGNYSRRDRLQGASFDQPEPAAMLTADRLLDASSRNRPAPESGWRRLVYFVTLKTVNPGDSLRVRERKALDARIGAPLDGGAKFVPVLTRKGGVGKTTVTTLLGMAMALVREDRVIAIDANPDRGTLAERVSKGTRATVRDVVNRAAAIDGFTEFSTMVSRDNTRLH
ncbi:MAG: hypothetical protein RL670_597, partial [Actinomycetota bacterium]